jgi:RNA-directed DNA polymerase
MPMDVDEMQTKLASWSQDPDFRFDDVYNLLYDEDWIRRACRSVRSNSGARTAGVDGQTMQDFKENRGKNLRELRVSLKSQSFNPRPVRRTYIPKGDGRERPLGIPAIKDRIVQEALRMVLEPIYETDFSDDSYGFRPNRSTHDARQKLVQAIVPAMDGGSWIVDADIKGFFDHVDHLTLRQIIRDRITDGKILDLIWDLLKSGIMEDGTYRHSTLGTPQGGVVSPLLANIYLDRLDQWVKQWTELTETEKRRRKRNGKGNWQYVRYADDFLLITTGRKAEAEKMLEKVENFVSEELNLTLSGKKSELVHREDGLNFLGYDIEEKSETGGVKREIPKEAERDIKSTVREATQGSTEVSIRTKVRAVNAVLRGWANYYKYATNASKVFRDVHDYGWRRMTHWLAEKLKCSMGKLMSQKMESTYPLQINGMAMVTITGMSGKYGKSCTRHDHPYLNNENTGWESLPEEDPWIGNERKVGWKDRRREALRRDNWDCQKCGRNLEGQAAHVHHKKPYSKTGDPNRLENLVSLCNACHQEIESSREYA